MKFYIDFVSRDEIRGWVIGERTPASIEVVVNRRPISADIRRVFRPDVIKVHPDPFYSGNCGFSVPLPTEPLVDGAIISVDLSLSADGETITRSFELPSRIGIATSNEAYWLSRGSPFPPSVMASVESASQTDWRTITDWSEMQFDEVIEIILFLLRTGSRRTPGLFSYFTYLSRVAQAFRFNENQFPMVTTGSGKDSVGIVSSSLEHFIIAHHLNTLKAHKLQGDFYEFGCFKGFSTSCLSFACKLLNVEMHVFDSFQGLPSSDSQYYSAGDFAGILEEVQRNIDNFGSPEVVTFHKGFFADVLPTIRVGPIAAIWLDVDLENSARDAMAVVANLDQRGCIFSHECRPELFGDDGSMRSVRGSDEVLYQPPEGMTDRRGFCGR